MVQKHCNSRRKQKFIETINVFLEIISKNIKDKQNLSHVIEKKWDDIKTKQLIWCRHIQRMATACGCSKSWNGWH